MSWTQFKTLAPHTAYMFERATRDAVRPILDQIPEFLKEPNNKIDDYLWSDYLNMSTAEGITNREIILRWLITRAIADQGSDIEGVEKWHYEVFSRCYRAGIRVFHEPQSFMLRYNEVLEIAHSVCNEVIEERAEIWASQSPTRHASNYTPFNVDSMWGGKQAHWFVSARVLPGLMAALTLSGGLTELIFDRYGSGTPSEMARHLRQDPKTGLGWAMGDKACDLFAKWAIGTFRLGDGLNIPWQASDCPIPMDQRVGRVMIRSGFMDELFGVARTMSKKSWGFTPRPDDLPRPAEGDPLPSGTWHLTVMNFRRNAYLEKEELKNLFTKVFNHAGFKVKKIRPQEAVSAISRLVAKEKNPNFSPVVLDDFMMRVAEICTDESPMCSKCPLQDGCQANTVPEMMPLKKYIT